MSEIAAVRIDPDGTVNNITLPPGDGCLHALYQQIGCGSVDLVRLTPQLDMWLDDEGMYSQDLNVLATFIARRLGWTQQPYFGPAVITGGADENCDIRGLDPAAATMLRDLAEAVLADIESGPSSTSPTTQDRDLR